MSESTDNLQVERLFQGLIPLIRKCMRFQLSPGTDGPRVESRFGGVPYMEEEESWPTCSGCRAALDFVCQFRLPDQLPDLPRRVALVGLYYCWSCAPAEGVARPKDAPLVVRLYEEPVDQLAIDPDRPATPAARVKPCRVEGQEGICLPSFVELPEDVQALSRDADSKAPAVVYESLVDTLCPKTHGESRVGGYPGWLAERQPVVCPSCQNAMSFMAQIDAESSAGVEWPHQGRMYLFFCRDHSSQVAYRLQSSK